MKGVCGIDFDIDKFFISIAGNSRQRLNYLEEAQLNVPLILEESDDFKKERNWDFLLKYIRENAEFLNKVIAAKETAHALKIDKIFFKLPAWLGERKIVEEVIPLKRFKKISARDLACARKYIEDISLEWDDFCVHHFVLSYQVEGKNYRSAPIGVSAKKLRMKSMLFSVKDKHRKEVEDVFLDHDRIFGGFVSQAASLAATPLTAQDRFKDAVTVNIGYLNTYAVILKEGSIQEEVEFNFGLRKIIDAISQRFLFSFSLAEEVFKRYVTFNAPLVTFGLAAGTEVSIKEGDSYINLSINTLNNFVKNYLRNELGLMFIKLKDKISFSGSTLSIVGRVNAKEGFSSFLRDFFPKEVSFRHCGNESTSLGCLKYGSAPFLEKTEPERRSFFMKIFNIYKNYF